MTRLVVIAAGLEVGTAGLLLVAPGAFAWLLLGSELSATGHAVGRFGGIALACLAVACWPRRHETQPSRAALQALAVFSLLCTAYLVALGAAGGAVGVLLWPAAATHGAIGCLLLLALRPGARSSAGGD